MACDMFSLSQANNLLRGKYIHFFGDSNIRGIYKDLLWLLEDGRLIPEMRLKKKNEESHANDFRISEGILHNGCDYDERREYNGIATVKFHFITRLYLANFIDVIKNLKTDPDVLIMNSCLWDLTRWGTDGVEQYKNNIYETFRFLKINLPRTRIIWVTSLPPSFKSRGGFLTKEIEFMRNMLPWHIVYANKYAKDVANFFSVDILDLHYHFRFLLNYHTPDGIHWDPLVVRLATNLLLTHFCLVWKQNLPGLFSLDAKFLANNYIIQNRQTDKNKTQTSNALQNISNTVNNRSKRDSKSLARITKRNHRTNTKNKQKMQIPLRAVRVNHYNFKNYK